MEAEQANRLFAMLRKRFKGRLPRCEACCHEDWAVGGGVLLPISLPVPGSMAGQSTWLPNGQILPVVALSCLHCGNVKSFNYLILSQEQQPLSPAERSIEAIRNVGWPN